MDQQQHGATFRHLDEIDPVAVARAIGEVEMRGIFRLHGIGTLAPAIGNLGTSGDGHAVIEAGIELLA